MSLAHKNRPIAMTSHHVALDPFIDLNANIGKQQLVAQIVQFVGYSA